ncbi:importin-9 [Pteropus vampyrus]|uniref:Importin-9 n=1 Tax=Pteropus vampyrus TaxID=132908 RepID=A0A6P6CSZ4_PTEVA|nr:importin-9 [Pteropus vampyrus]
MLLQRSTGGDVCPPMRRALVTTDDDQQVRVHGPLKRLQVDRFSVRCRTHWLGEGGEVAGRRSAVIGENEPVPVLGSLGTASPCRPARVSHLEEPTSASSVLPEAGSSPFLNPPCWRQAQSSVKRCGFPGCLGPTVKFSFPEFGVHLAELTVDPQGALAIRQLASVILKQYVETHWCAQSERFRPPETTERAKGVIRELLPSGLRESVSKVRSSVAYAVSAIAHWDWPEAWPQLFSLLMGMLVSGDLRAVHGAMRVLTGIGSLPMLVLGAQVTSMLTRRALCSGMALEPDRNFPPPPRPPPVSILPSPRVWDQRHVHGARAGGSGFPSPRLSAPAAGPPFKRCALTRCVTRRPARCSSSGWPSEVAGAQLAPASPMLCQCSLSWGAGPLDVRGALPSLRGGTEESASLCSRTRTRTCALSRSSVPQVYGIRTRSRAVEIFTACAHMICNMEELEKGAAKALIFPVVQQFTEAFVQALQVPDGPTSDSGFKMEVLKAVTALVKNFPKHMVSSMQQILPIVWNTLTDSAAFYVRTEVNYTEEVEDPVDSDGEVLGFENLVFSIFEFVHALLENSKFKSTVKKALPELVYYVILYMQITEEQIKVWTANPQQFVEDEDDDTFSYTVRIAAQDLLLAVATDFQNESAAALAAAATRHLQEAEQTKDSGAEHWWKVHEACMLALGSAKSVVTDSVKSGRVHFDMHGFLTRVVLADLSLSVSPFLLGRALWAASRFTVAMSPELVQQFLQATVSGLHETQPPSVRISAVRAIWGYCDQLKASESTHVLQPFLPGILDGLIHLAAQFSSEVLSLVMETLCTVCTVDPAFTASVESKVCPFTIAVFLKYSNDPVVASLAQDIFKELSQIEACQGPMQMRLIPTLVSIMQAPADKLPAGLCATAIDILTTVVRSTQPPLSQLLICQAFPAVAQCTLHTDDNATMQVPAQVTRGGQLSSTGFWALREEPHTHVRPEHRTGSGRKRRSLSASERGGHPDTWGRQHLFYGQYEGKVSSVALCKLLQHGINTDDRRLQDIRVKGEELYSVDEGVRTRSKSAKNPERWTNIPLLVKILKLIINELSTVMEANAARQTAPAEWGQDDSNDMWEDPEDDEEEEEDGLAGQLLSDILATSKYGELLGGPPWPLHPGLSRKLDFVADSDVVPPGVWPPCRVEAPVSAKPVDVRSRARRPVLVSSAKLLVTLLMAVVAAPAAAPGQPRRAPAEVRPVLV